MKKMKQLVAMLLALIALVGCFVGCAQTQPDVEATTPSSSVPTPSSKPEVKPVEIDPLWREAVTQTALAYLARGNRIQYDDTRLNSDSHPTEPVLYRWQSCVRTSPEEYTSQYTGYTNCAAFVGEVYMAALGIDLGTQTTGGLTGVSDIRRVYNYVPTGEETEEEKAAMEAEFRATLQFGDVIVIRYGGAKAGQGHAMLYVDSEILKTVDGYKGAAVEGTDENGNPKEDTYVYDIIHSTGSSYKYATGTEKYEPYGSVQKTSVDTLFESTHGRYVFSKLLNIAIVRPLNTFTGTIPQNTLNRMKNMKNILAEKLSSHVPGKTVNPGENMTFTYAITNKNAYEVTLPVTDVIPANATLVSAENCTVDGTDLRWEETIPAGQTREISYTIKINEDAAIGTYVAASAGTVGGVAVKCYETCIGRTLLTEEQKAVLAAAKSLSGGELQNLELVNAIYHTALGTQNLLPGEYAVLADGLYMKENGYGYLATDGAYQDMIVPGLFGGRMLLQRQEADPAALTRFENQRTRLIIKEQLIVGDILVADKDVKCKVQVYYLFTGDGLLDLTSGELLSEEDSAAIFTGFICNTRFAVLRPSLKMEK